MTAALKRLVHVGCRDLGIDSDTRRAMQLQVVGKESLADMTAEELASVVAALKAKGFRRRPSGKGRPKAKRADVRYAHVLWGLLGNAGKLDRPGRAGLNAFVQKRFADTWGAAALDVDMLTDHRQIDDLIQALKAWCRREGIPTER